MNSEKMGVYLSSMLPAVANDPIKGVLKISEMGFKNVQFPTRERLFPEGNGEKRIEALFQQAELCGLKVTAVNADISKTDARSLEQRIKPMLDVVDMAVRHKAPIVIVHGGESITEDEDMNQQAWQRLVENMRQLVLYADKKGVGIAMEPGGPFWMIHGWQLLVRLRKEVGELLKINFDPANVLMGAENPIDGIYALGSAIVHVHIKDAGILHPNDAVNRYHLEIDNTKDKLDFVKWLTAARSTSKYYQEFPVGKGEVDFPEMMKALKEISYDGPLVIEREGSENRIEDIRQTKQYIENILSRRKA